MSVKAKCEGQMNRRGFLKLGTYGALVHGISPNPLLAQANPDRRRFIVMIQCGSWDGWSSGLLQAMPSGALGAYPAGVFAGASTQSPNPLVNQLYREGQLVFNQYSSPLQAISSQTMAAVVLSESLNHYETMTLRGTGATISGLAGQPCWAAGLGQALLGNKTTAHVIQDIIDARDGSGQTASTTPDVGLAAAANINALKEKFSDPSLIPGGVLRDRYLAVLLQLHGDKSPLRLPENIVKSASNGLLSLNRGIPGIDPAHGDVSAQNWWQDVQSALTTLSNANQMADLQGVLTENPICPGANQKPNLLTRLELAAALIETQAAAGMTISAGPNLDQHDGGGAVDAARAGAMTWACITRFWQWVQSKGYDDDVLVVVSHEFGRTGSNGHAGKSFTIPGVGQVNAFGTDHSVATGYILINGKLPGEQRVGGMTLSGGNLPFGQASLLAEPSSQIKPYTSMSLMGSVLMRVYDDVFPDWRSIKSYWGGFSEDKVISFLL